MKTQKFVAGGHSPLIETLEPRTFLSSTVTSEIHPDVTKPTSHVSMHVSRHSAKLGQSIVISAKVTAAKKLGAIAGGIEFLNHGSPVEAKGSILSVTPDDKGKITYVFGVGDVALFAGRNTIRAAFVSSNSITNSISQPARINVTVPRFRVASDGLQTATVVAGKGKGAAAGQTAAVLYTGFLSSDASIFDFGPINNPAGFSFPIEASPEQVISGVDQGVIGMKLGETRVMAMPPTLAYGSTGQGAIPPDASLVFFMKLISLT